jgi:ribonuclease BN (tRNA processing enzyme)
VRENRYATARKPRKTAAFASIRLTDSSAIRVDHYAAFIHASAIDVVEQALAYLFSKDRDFQESLKSSEAQRITPTLRFRRVPGPDAVELPAKKPLSAASSSVPTAAMAGETKA